MASSRRSPPPADAVFAAVAEAIAATKAAVARTGPLRIAVGLSGGRDSMALLDALAAAAPAHGIVVSAVHVDHGLSPHARAWSDFCAAECARRRVPLTVEPVNVSRTARSGIEAAARAARYLVYDGVAADAVALAHHADDQAETLLLQLVRGAGPHGLAAMPMLRVRSGMPALLRPFLALPRRTIDAYARARGLAFVDDESNADVALRRNFLRHELLPRLAAVFPGCPATLARAALHQAEAALLCDELAAIDAREALAIDADAGETLDRRTFGALAATAPHRARNVLRWFLRRHGLRAPSAARLAAMQRQLVAAAGDARVRLAHDGVELGVHRGRIVIHAASVAAFALPWRGETKLALPHGTLEFAPAEGRGLALSVLERGPIVVRPRGGGERIRLGEGRPRQALKRLLQSAGVPAWQRDALPLVWCGDALAAVPGIGVDVAFAAHGAAPGRELRWCAGPASGSHSHWPLD
jgi:tRNA(Ile)-lysidine synthase